MRANKRKPILAAVAVALVLVGVYLLLRSTGILRVLGDVDALRAYLSGLGPWAQVVFFLVQFAQVLLAPIPGGVTALAGGMAFGFVRGTLLSVAGVVLGSVAAFALARSFGRPLVVRLVKPELVDKYVDILARKGTAVLAAMFLLPFFPDDALCLIAGLTGLHWGIFLLLVVVTRPLGLLFATLVGSGQLSVPVWGWVLIGVACVALMALSMRYGERISAWLLGLFEKSNKRKTK